MPLQHAHIIDLIALDPESDEVILTMTEPRPWDGSDRRVYELQEKVNAYLSFALDGEMNEQLPELNGKRLKLQLDCLGEPDPKTAYFIGMIQRQIGFQDVQFAVRIVPDLVASEESGGCCGGGGGGCCGDQEDHGHDHSHAENGESGCCGGGGAGQPSGGGCGCS